jgi:hypothetical protein
MLQSHPEQRWWRKAMMCRKILSVILYIIGALCGVGAFATMMNCQGAKIEHSSGSILWIIGAVSSFGTALFLARRGLAEYPSKLDMSWLDEDLKKNWGKEENDGP